MPDAVSMMNSEFTARIEQIKAENPYDELDMDNAGSAAMISNCGMCWLFMLCGLPRTTLHRMRLLH